MYGQEILSDILQDSWVSIKLKLHLSALIGYFRKKVNDKLQLGCIKKQQWKHCTWFLTALQPEYKVNHRNTALQGYGQVCVQEQAGLWPKDVGLGF